MDLDVNQHSTVTHYPRPTVTHLQEGGQVGRCRRRASPRAGPAAVCLSIDA